MRAHLIRYDCSYHISQIADLLATKFNWMAHHHKLECSVLKLHCCFHGQDYSKDSSHWMLMYPICSVPLISRQPKKVCWFTIHNNQTLVQTSWHLLTVALWLTLSLGTRRMGWGILPHKATNLVLSVKSLFMRSDNAFFVVFCFCFSCYYTSW